MWSDPEPVVGDIIGVEIRYLIDCVPQNIPELGGGVNQYSVSGIKGSEGKTHSISLRARTSAEWGNYSTPVEFVFQPIGEMSGMDAVDLVGERQNHTSCMPCLCFLHSLHLHTMPELFFMICHTVVSSTDDYSPLSLQFCFLILHVFCSGHYSKCCELQHTDGQLHCQPSSWSRE